MIISLLRGKTLMVQIEGKRFEQVTNKYIIIFKGQ
jgi:hypothetical protein